MVPVQTRGLRSSSPRNEFLDRFAPLLESPSILDPTVPKHTTGCEQASLGLGALALAAQNNRKRTPTITTLNPEQLTPADVIHLLRDAHTLTVSFKLLLALSSNVVSSVPVPTHLAYQRDSDTPARHTFPIQRPAPASCSTRGDTARCVRRQRPFRRPVPRRPRLPVLPPALGPLHAPRRRAAPPLISSLSSDLKAWTAQSVRAAFAHGHDFSVLPGMSWHIPVLALPLGSYDAVRTMLLHEGLVATRVMRDAEREGRRWSLKRHNSRVLNGFGLPFVVDLGTKRLRFYFVGQRAVYRHVLWDLCSCNRHGAHEAHQPFTGTLELLLES